MIQVSIGNRSRSPFSPLSLRMMSRADLISEPSDCAVVAATSVRRFITTAFFPSTRQADATYLSRLDGLRDAEHTIRSISFGRDQQCLLAASSVRNTLDPCRVVLAQMRDSHGPTPATFACSDQLMTLR